MRVFTVIHVLFTKSSVYQSKNIRELITESFHFGANIANFIHDDLPFFKGTLMQI